MIRSQMTKFKSQILMFLIVTAFFLLPTASAQTCSVQDPYPRVKDGLISTPNISGSDNFRNDIGKCVFDPSKTAFAPYKIPSYADLKSLYYTQAKSPIRRGEVVGSPNQGQFTSVFTNNDVILVNGNLPDLNYTGTTKPTIIFVENSLSIDNNLTYGNTNSGIVFVVQGDVNIAKSVKRIDAVIVSSGAIRTAGSSCSTNSEEVNTKDDALTINGSLISLDASEPIQFCRKLKGSGNDTDPAEIINFDPKYLVILRSLFADTLQKWSEIQ